MKKKILGKLNVIDIILIVIIVIAVLGFIFRFSGPFRRTDTTAFTLTFEGVGYHQKVLDYLSPQSVVADAKDGHTIGSVINHAVDGNGILSITVSVLGTDSTHGIAIGGENYLIGGLSTLMIGDAILPAYLVDITIDQ